MTSGSYCINRVHIIPALPILIFTLLFGFWTNDEVGFGDSSVESACVSFFGMLDCCLCAVKIGN